MTKQRLPGVAIVERHLRSRFIAGLLIVVPIGITAFVLRFVFDFLDGLLASIASTVSGQDIDLHPGVGIGFTLVLVYIVGLVTANMIGRQVVGLVHNVVERLPIVRSIYSAVRQIVEAVSGTGQLKFNRVVIIDWPRPGVKAVGFVTGQVIYRGSERMTSIYLPTTPNPTSGFLAIVPETDVTETNISVEDAIKLFLSGGIVAPTAITTTERTSQSTQQPPGAQ
ncbi:MAG: DUF502 domain-containing protein [Chloroflexi bacterium]|nr:DUF502 domain-containing protein [Chloroflexota bacterium]